MLHMYQEITNRLDRNGKHEEWHKHYHLPVHWWRSPPSFARNVLKVLNPSLSIRLLILLSTISPFRFLVFKVFVLLFLPF